MQRKYTFAACLNCLSKFFGMKFIKVYCAVTTLLDEKPDCVGQVSKPAREQHVERNIQSKHNISGMRTTYGVTALQSINVLPL